MIARFLTACRAHVILLALILLAVVSVPHTASAQQSLSDTDKKHYKEAFRALDRKKTGDALAFARRAKDQTLAEVIKAGALGLPGNPFSFADTISFIETHDDWPGLDDIRRMAEEKMPDSWPAQQTVNWFTAHPALTMNGFYRHMDALFATGQTAQAALLIRGRWTGGNFTRDELRAFRARFSSTLRPQDHWARTDQLIWDEAYDAARRMYDLISTDRQALAEARIAYGEMDRNAEARAARVPGSLRDDPGLLYERLRWLRNKSRDDEAVQILLHPPSDLGVPKKWWAERHIIMRRMIELRDLQTAYQLTHNHGQTEGLALQQAEFMAGWLALRFFNKPEHAAKSFLNLYNGVSTPVSKSRGAYWLGRTYESLRDTATARHWYDIAATMGTTFYGQLALARLHPGGMLKIAEPDVPEAARSAFKRGVTATIIWQLQQIGQNDRTERFMIAAAWHATARNDYALLAELAKRMGKPELMVKAAKKAAAKNFILPVSGFPVLDNKLPSRPEAALIHAIIRQESMFKADAVSPAGARGLMQLMPSTARMVGKKQGIKVSNTTLFGESTNIRLGSAYLAERIDGFGGSLPLAIAAYNAGQTRARQWIETFGDPRSPRLDPVDWIELIPIYETRNYVQRVIENLQIYRARLGGGQAALGIMDDLRR
ncbi:MAG: transglycosylase SLT domain-containing protein [Alphaproteobacteria bacterium]|nr:transglycosylase SLT domain-containing protein [Alphaproteobacteria bacterium]